MFDNLFQTWMPHILVGVLAYARVAPLFLMLPFFNKSVLSHGVVRSLMILLSIVGLWPAIANVPDTVLVADYFWVALQESLIGAMLGCAVAFPFWVFHAAGAFIDVGRGATVSSSIDPVNGLESAETSNLLNLLAGVIFLELGGMQKVLAIIVESYQVWGMHGEVVFMPERLARFLGYLLNESFKLAAPVLLIMFLSEILLGVLSKVAPQMNAFSVSLTIKSFLAVSMLVLYLGSVFPEKMSTLSAQYHSLFIITSGAN